MPSMATEPFSMMYLDIFSEVLMVTHTAFSSSLMDVMVPVPSMWPLTMCPPNLPFAGIALSRLTLLPCLSMPRELLDMVSLITSAVNMFALMCDTVRHTPFTATLSPSPRSSNIFFPSIQSLDDLAPLSILTILPVSSIIPVNIFPPHIPAVCRHP